MFMLFHYDYLFHSTDDGWHKDGKYLVDIQYCILLEYHWALPAETNVRARDLARGLLCAVCESVRVLQEKKIMDLVLPYYEKQLKQSTNFN